MLTKKKIRPAAVVRWAQSVAFIALRRREPFTVRPISLLTCVNQSAGLDQTAHVRAASGLVKGTPNRVPKRISLASFMSEFPMPCCGPRVVLSLPCGRRKLYGDVGLGPANRDSAPLGTALGKGGGRDRAKQPRLIRRWINERPHHAPRRLDLYILSTSLRVWVGGEGAIASRDKSLIRWLLDRSISRMYWYDSLLNPYRWVIFLPPC